MKTVINIVDPHLYQLLLFSANKTYERDLIETIRERMDEARDYEIGAWEYFEELRRTGFKRRIKR